MAIAGLPFQSSVACSNACAMRSTPKSSQLRLTIWIPTGSLSSVKLAGTEIAGCREMVM